MAEALLLPDTTTKVDLLPPAGAALASGPEQLQSGFIDSRCYFEGISENQRELNKTMLALDARHWVERIPGLEGRSGIFVGDISNNGHNDNNGVPNQSIKIANKINSGQFGMGAEKELKDENGYPKREPVTEDDFNTLIATAPNEGLALYARMLRDMEYPQDYREVPKLEPKPFDKARDIVLSKGGNKTETKGIFCGEAEGRFMDSASRSQGLEEIKLGDDVIALKKDNGEQTALLTRDATLNGVLLPKGSIVTVDYDEETGVPQFAFARLSAFVVGSPQEIEAMAPNISKNEYFKNHADGYEKVRELLGQGTSLSSDDLMKSLQSIDQFFTDDPQSSVIAANLEQKKTTIDLEQDTFDLMVNDLYDEVNDKYPLDTSYLPEDGPEEKARKLAYSIEKDVEIKKIGAISNSAQNPKYDYLHTVTELEKTYGREKVILVMRLQRDREIAARVLATSTQY